MAFSPFVLTITTANSRSTVHRPDYLAYVGVKRFDKEGRVFGERRFLGLYNADVYRDSVLDIPLLRDKAVQVLDRAGFDPESHNGRALRQILETYPRNDLFQIGADELFEIATGILDLQDRRQVRLFSRRDDYGRFISCLVYLPRDRYSTSRADLLAAALEEEYGGTGNEHDVLIGSGALARLHVRVSLGPEARHPQIADVEKRLTAIAADWADELGVALVSELGEDAGLSALARFADAFPADYRDAYPPSIAAIDVGPLARDRGRARPHHRAAPPARRVTRRGAVHPDASRRASRALGGAAAPRAPRCHRGGRAAARDPRRRPQRLALRHRPAGRATPSGSTILRSATSSAPPSPPCSEARSRATASTGWSWSPVCGRVRSSSCGPTPSTSARSACRSARATSRTP